MKIILSRKGFDSSNGGCPSPIMPDGTLLSLPIPSEDKDSYKDLQYKGTTYSQILNQLQPNKSYSHCHVDPDIRTNCRVSPIAKWKPAFGQINAAQGVLNNAGVEEGDIFLFFGKFRRVEFSSNGYNYVSKRNGTFYDHSDLHVIFGYMQIGKILTKKEEILKYTWHPHSSDSRINEPTNTIYLPTNKLSILPELNGYGTLSYRKDRVLTMENKATATWNKLPFLTPEHIYGNRKNSAKGEGLYYRGIWQELVINQSDDLIEWVKSILK